jgi:hypothetical protein
MEKKTDPNDFTSSCISCPSGKAAVKIMEFEDFEVIPSFIHKKCSIIDSNLAS